MATSTTGSRLIFAALLDLSGCSDDGDDGGGGPRPEAPRGMLDLAWSIDGQRDAALCDEIEAVAFHMDVFDQGFFVGFIEVPCADFVASDELRTDDYVGRSTLIDSDGFAVSSRVIEDYFYIAEGQVTGLAMDFPSAGGLPMSQMGDAGVPPADAGADAEGDAGSDAGDAAAAQ
jgi:hypothetical protein